MAVAAVLAVAGAVAAGGAVNGAGAAPAQVEHFAATARDGAPRPFSEAVRVGDMLYLSGQIGIRPDGGLPEGIDAQTQQMMANIGAALARAGAGWGDVVHCLVMLDDMADWAAFNRVYVPYFPAGRLPARSAFGADGLALGARVEMECKARLPAAR